LDRTKEKVPGTQKITLKDFDRTIQDLGKSFINQLYVTIKTAQIYEPNNYAYLKQSQNLAKVIRRLLEEKNEIFLQLKEGYLFLNEVRLKFDFAGYIGNSFVIEELERTKIGTITILPEVDQREVDKFVYLLNHFDSDPPNIFELIQNRLSEVGIVHIGIEKYADQNLNLTDMAALDNRKIAKKTFFKAISLAQEIMTNVRNSKAVNIAKAKRVVQTMVDQIIKDEALFLELSTIKNFDEYTFVHSANVSVLSIILGLRLGLDRKKLSELGFAALFHDIGKVKLPIDLINKPAQYDELDWAMMQKHPIMGVKTLVFTRDIDEYTSRAVLVVFEHHMHLDLSGYPKVKNHRSINLFTRIVNISDAYNAMTSGRVYIKEAIPPHEALRKMVRTSGVNFDPVLLKLFVNIMGIYPVGSLVMLDTKEIGIVFKSNIDNPYRPKVKIIGDSKGKKEIIEIVDLNKLDDATGTFKRSIVKALDANKYNINVSKYLVDY